jgi:hypothetical protein
MAGNKTSRRKFLELGAVGTATTMLSLRAAEETTPITADEIADLPAPKNEAMSRETIEKRMRNLWLMDFAIKKCEYRKHIVAYEPFITHILYGAWQNKPRVDARDEVPYAFIDKYAKWGVQIVELHHDVWAHFGRLEPINEAVFTRFVDYCHKQRLKVYVYITGAATSLSDPPQDVGVFALPLYGIRPPETYGKKTTEYLAKPWAYACPGSPAWHHYVLTGIERLFTRYKVDGLYFDSGIVFGMRCKHRSKVYGVQHYERVLDSMARDASPPWADQGPRNNFSDYEVDIFNEVCDLVKTYNKGLTVYMNSVDRFGNYDLPNRVIDHRLVGEAGDTKSLKYFMDINRGMLKDSPYDPEGYFKRSIYQIYAWWDRNTMPAEEPYYACNIPFVQFPFLMQGKFAMDPGWSDETEALWVHYGRIYREMAKDNTVAYVNVRDSKIFRKPLQDERLVSSFFVRENIYVVLANLSDKDEDVEFTVPLENVETMERNVTKVHLKANGSLRIFRVNPDDLMPKPEEDPVRSAIDNIDNNTRVDFNNLALEGRAHSSSVFKGPFGSAAAYLMDTQANDGNVDTYWFQDFDVEHPKDNQWWYMVELRKRAKIEKIQVVTRPEDVDKVKVLLSGADWNDFQEPRSKHVSKEIANGKAYLTYIVEPFYTRYLKTTGPAVGKDVRVYEIRAYESQASPILDEKGSEHNGRLVTKVSSETIENSQDLALGRSVSLNYPCRRVRRANARLQVPFDPDRRLNGGVGQIIDGDAGTEGVADEIWAGGGPLWAVVDLGKVARLDAIQYVPGQAEVYERRKQDTIGQDGRLHYAQIKSQYYQQYRIYISADAMRWLLVADESENREPSNSHGKTYAFDPLKARYVAVRVDYTSAGKGLPIGIGEIRVRGR